MMITQDTINRLKIAFYERWNPEQYGYMMLEMRTGAILFTNDLDCNGNPHFNHKSFLSIINNWNVTQDQSL